MTQQITPGLTSLEIEEIRKILPYSWRLQIQLQNPALTTRQISEAFYHRNRNADHAEKVFSVISCLLVALHQKELAEKCLHRIAFCKAAQIVPAI